MTKIYRFKDQDDYIKKITDDDIINIIGTKGSGKTTSSLKYMDNNDYIVVNCDRLFELPSTEKEDKELNTIRKMLKNKYESLKIDDDFTNIYNDIVVYILNKNKKGLIEGNSIQNINPTNLKGTVIIKRTSAYKSYKRAVKRDYQNEYFMNLEKEKHKYIYKITRLYKIKKRRKKIFKQSKEIENIIRQLEEYKK